MFAPWHTNNEANLHYNMKTIMAAIMNVVTCDSTDDDPAVTNAVNDCSNNFHKSIVKRQADFPRNGIISMFAPWHTNNEANLHYNMKTIMAAIMNVVTCDSTEVLDMNNSGEIRRAISTGLIVAVFLLNTSRALKAIDLCNECLYILGNKAFTKEREVIQAYHNIIYWITFTAYCVISDYTNAIKYGKELLVMCSKCGEKAFEGMLSLRMAELYHFQSKHFKVTKLCAKALEIFTETGERKGEASCYESLGIVFLSLGECVKAKDNLEKALEIQNEIGDRIGAASSYENLGNVFYSLGEFRKAKDYTEKELAIRKKFEDKRGEAASYGKLGNIYLSLGEYFKSVEYLEKALAIRKETGDREGEAADYSKLGNVFRCLGEYVKAKDYHEKALRISQEIGDRNGEATSKGNLGTSFLHLGEYVKAKEHTENALVIRKEIGDRDGESTEYVNLGNVFLILGKYAKANDYFQKALAITKETGCRKGEAATYGSLGSVSRLKNIKRKHL
ncbi:hypothetical protein ACROYT_G000764 [Oculina patagonica]